MWNVLDKSVNKIYNNNNNNNHNNTYRQHDKITIRKANLS